MIVIGLDVATIKTGYCIAQDGSYISSGVIENKSKEELFSNKTNEGIKSIWNSLISLKIPKDKEALIVAETSIIYQKAGQFMSAKTSEKLSIYVGIYLTVFKLWLENAKLMKVTIKMIGPSTWQSYLGWGNLERAKLKSNSIIEANKVQWEKVITSDDEADAILICLIGGKSEVKDFWEIAHIRKTINSTKLSLTNKIKKSEGMVHKYQMIINSRIKANKKPLANDLAMLNKHKELINQLKETKRSLNPIKENDWPTFENGN